MKINLGGKIKALTFALPIKKRVQSKAKRSLKVWKQQHESSDSQKVMLAQILIEFDVIISRENTTVRSKLLYNGEFDPGSG